MYKRQAYVNLPSVAIAAIGIIIVILQWNRDKQIMDLENKQKNINTTHIAETLDNQDQEEEEFFS